MRPRRADDDGYRPVSARRRLLIALLAVSTAVTIVLMMFGRWGAPPLVRHLQDDAAACGEGQTSGCVGGKADVIVVPAANAASAMNGTGR